jgi:hypothetical protein
VNFSVFNRPLNRWSFRPSSTAAASIFSAFCKRQKPMGVQAFAAKAPVERLDEGIIRMMSLVPPFL